ncbi:hypothetical protein AC625_01530 [Peribacillus loiseleuriae]|uniref:Uncharacterized protein n=1 Tax=Peribacillus loiseleuriae TaxID=1679170 RepID=A0A0K9GNX8_9BACI|nr:hypothetical protein AC625_01530 [Peribacillus loiseleuriae]
MVAYKTEELHSILVIKENGFSFVTIGTVMLLPNYFVQELTVQDILVLMANMSEMNKNLHIFCLLIIINI